MIKYYKQISIYLFNILIITKIYNITEIFSWFALKKLIHVNDSSFKEFFTLAVNSPRLEKALSASTDVRGIIWEALMSRSKYFGPNFLIKCLSC